MALVGCACGPKAGRAYVDVLVFHRSAIIIASVATVFSGLPMKCFARCTLAFLIALIVSAMVVAGFAWFAASWLSIGDAPVKADRMLILSGDPLRAIYAAELYRDGFAKEIYLTRTMNSKRTRTYEEMGFTFPRLEDVSRAILVKKGVDERDIHMLDAQQVLSTADEANAVREGFGRAWAGRLLIVTSPYHVRRAKIIFHDAMPDVSIYFVASPYDRLPAKWWTDQAAARQVVLEYAKMAYYVLGGRFTAKVPVQLP
jgi:uncharacterized SAM-binding protein YcdF (DUF218 family)